MGRSKPTDLPRHPIGVVRERTGLSVEVLRAWERRYAVVRPSRSREGRRLYSDADVERLGLLHRASRAGRAVGALVTLSTGELRQMVLEDAEHAHRTPAPSGSHCEDALEAVRQLAPERLEALLRRALFSLGAFTFLEEVVAPLLEEIGDAWHEGLITVAHEHAASAAVLQVLGGLARALEVPGNAPRVVLATTRGERHAFGAMMAAVAAAHDGWHVTWLGSDLPAAQVAAGAEECEARIVGLSSVARNAAGLKREVTSLRALLPSHVPVLIGGPGTARLRDMRGVTKVRDLSHWRALLTTARAT